MPRPLTVSARALSLRLQSQGLMSARQLADALGVDRSTISRGLAGLGSAVLRVGAARSSRYALRRLVRNLGQRWPALS
jgi:predicted DNA-binding transcriptional regulator YafY